VGLSALPRPLAVFRGLLLRVGEKKGNERERKTKGERKGGGGRVWP